MSNKIHSTAIVLAGLLFSLVADASADIEQAKQNVLTLIKAGNYAQAREQTQQVIFDSPKTSALSDALSSIAMQFELSDKYVDAKGLYQHILQNSPDSTWASKAKLGIARTDVLSLIMAGDSHAKEVFDKLLADFAGHPDLPETFYYVARRYEWADKYEDAKGIYQRMIKNTTDDAWTGKANLGIARTDVLFLIMSKDSRAEEAVNKLITGFKDHPDIQDTLYWVARRYEWADKYKNAKIIYSQMLQNTSDTSWTDKAKLGFARADILSLIMSQNYSGAKEAFEKLLTENLSGNEDWPDTLYWIAERYKWAGRYQDAKDFYEKIVQGYPNSPYASRAKIGIPRADVQSRVRSYDFDGAKKSLDKLVADFNDHPDLPETLYWVAEKYRLSENYEEEKAVYQQLLEKYPDNPYASKAKLGLARTNVQILIGSQDYDSAEEAFDKLVADFNEHPRLEDSLYAIARSYGAANRYEEERGVYQRIIQKYPDSSYIDKAKIGVSKTGVTSLIASGDYNQAGASFDKLVTDFSGHSDLPKELLVMGEQYYAVGLSNERAELEVQAKNYYEKAAEILDRLVSESNSASILDARYWASDCYRRLGQYEKARDFCQHALNLQPESGVARRLKIDLAQSNIFLGNNAAAESIISELVAGLNADSPNDSNFSPNDSNFFGSASNIYYYMGDCYCQSGQHQAAKALYEQVILCDPNSPQAMMARSDISRIALLSLSPEEQKRAISFFESQHRSWLKVRSGSANYEIRMRDIINGKFVEDSNRKYTGTLEFEINPLNDTVASISPAEVRVRLFNNESKCNVVVNNILDPVASSRQWGCKSDSNIGGENLAGSLKEVMALLFFPVDFMAQTYSDDVWDNKCTVPKREFFAKGGLPIRRSSRNETEGIFGGEEQYLFMPCPDPVTANYWFSAENGDLRQIDISSGEGGVRSLRYENYTQKRGKDVKFPQRCVFTCKKGNADGTAGWEYTVELSDVKLNIDIPADKFI